MTESGAAMHRVAEGVDVAPSEQPLESAANEASVIPRMAFPKNGLKSVVVFIDDEPRSPPASKLSRPRQSAEKEPMTAKKACEYKELLKTGKWFHGLPGDLQDGLLEIATVERFGPNERLFAIGQAPNGLFGVVEGSVRLSTRGPDGSDVLLMLAERPQWIGEIALFDGQPRSHDAFADVETVVVHVPERAIGAWLERDPRVWRSLGTLLTTKMRLVLAALAEISTLPLGTRLAQRLVHMASGYGDLRIGTARVVTVSQEQLAAMLWTSRQTVNRELKSLESDGLVRVSYGSIEILDIDGLRRGGCPAER